MNQNNPSSLVTIVVITLVFLLPKTSLCEVDPKFEACVPKTCGDDQNISFPFWIEGRQKEFCGHPRFQIVCNKNGNPTITISRDNYTIKNISYEDKSIRVTAGYLDLISNTCYTPITNLTPLGSRFQIDPAYIQLYFYTDCISPLPNNLTSYKVNCSSDNGTSPILAVLGADTDTRLKYVSRECRRAVATPVEVYKDEKIGGGWEEYNKVMRRGFALNWIASDCSACRKSGGRCGFDAESYLFRCFCPDGPRGWQCRSVIQLPVEPTSRPINADPFSFLTADIYLDLRYVNDCFECPKGIGQCRFYHNGTFQCVKAKTGRSNGMVIKLALGIGLPVVFIIILLFFYIIRRRYKWKYGSSRFLSSNISSDPNFKSEQDRGCLYFGIPIFSYSELEEATHNFDPNKELGDGGFGTVYYGKLQDGREVAVKRLYESNYRRVEQFMNEVEILTRLRHKNLVSLYGCTSRHSRELLLVYEYIPNGTVADHLHGDQAKPSPLSWSVRMSIAIETASALAYLHSSEIIHRDVKTNNILLDDNFSVKVADFGLSRLFPTDVTHISTAPQGTPGYVDPEYHQCYQLTVKSDVYSFGVVLIELISSLPAVDISRHRHEINLSNLALNKIQNRAFHELVDPCLGFETNFTVRVMTTLVAELAFRCLQQDKEVRPSMEEVLEVLKGIQNENYEMEKTEESENNVGVLNSTRQSPPSDSDDVRLLKKNMPLPPSPVSVTDNWVSSSTIHSASSG